jgi:hypothetical protein
MAIELKTYSSRKARDYYSAALAIETDAANSGNKQMAAKAELLKIMAEAAERGGAYPLRRMKNGRSTGGTVQEWNRLLRHAKGCYPGVRPEGWLKEMQEELGVVIVGGTPSAGPLTAKLVKRVGGGENEESARP